MNFFSFSLSVMVCYISMI